MLTVLAQLSAFEQNDSGHVLQTISFSHPPLQVMLDSVKNYLSSLYQDRLIALIHYGSSAHDLATFPDSDIDIAVVLRDINKTSDEIFRTLDFQAEFNLQYGIVLDLFFCSESDGDCASVPVISHIVAQGVYL